MKYNSTSGPKPFLYCFLMGTLKMITNPIKHALEKPPVFIPAEFLPIGWSSKCTQSFGKGPFKSQLHMKQS